MVCWEAEAGRDMQNLCRRKQLILYGKQLFIKLELYRKGTATRLLEEKDVSFPNCAALR